MAEWVCRACTAAYAVGAPACPQCGSTDRAEEQRLNLPRLRVTCNLPGCRYNGVDRDVHLRSAGIGLFEVPTLICAGCGSQLFAACNDLPLEDDDVPKITVHGGPSNADLTEREHVPGEPLPEAPASAYAEDAEPLDPAPGDDKTPRPKPTPARKPRARKAADSTGSTGLKVTAEANVTRDGETP